MSSGGLAQLVECALCKREAPGSKPGFSTPLWSYSVMVITLDFESSDPGSSPGRTFFAASHNQYSTAQFSSGKSQNFEFLHCLLMV